MEIQKELQNLIKHGLKQAFDYEIAESSVVLERPANADHGDWATNVALMLAKELKKSPREIAEKLVNELQITNYKLQIDRVEVAGPGFINFYLSNDANKDILAEIIKKGEFYGKSDKYSGRTYLIEHTSPNPTGDMHIGHWKNNVTGLSLSYLFEAVGVNVIRDCINNNRGIAIAKVMWGYLKFGRKDNDQNKTDIRYWSTHREEWHTPESIGMTPGRFMGEVYYKGANDFKENIEVEKKVRQMLIDWESEDKVTWRLWELTQDWIWQGYERVLKRIDGWKFDKIWNEHEIYKEGKEHVYRGLKEGIFKKLEDGAIITNLKKGFGLTDTILIRSDGTSLYITQDLQLTNLKKRTFNPDEMFWVIGPEQKLQMAQAFAVASQLGFGEYTDFHHIPYGFIFLLNSEGKQVKMSKRLGNMVYVDDLIDDAKRYLQKFLKNPEVKENEKDEILEKIALGAIKYSMLRVNRLKDQVFSFENMLSFEGDSAPYLMYTYARSKSILKKGSFQDLDLKMINIVDVLNDSLEQEVLKALKEFPNKVIEAAEKFETHIIPNYLFELAQKYNNFYNSLSVLSAEKEGDKKARLLLTAATAQVLKNGLNLLGIETVEKM
jgi:arginyl-tRNA synthetase